MSKVFAFITWLLVVTGLSSFLKKEVTTIRPRASIVLVVKRGKILAVSRKGKPNDFGLPGGSVEDLEDPRSAAIREFYEEIGYDLIDAQFVSRHVYDGRDVYIFSGHVDECPDIWPARGPEGTRIAWIRPSELSIGTFADFNQEHIVPLVTSKGLHTG